MFEKKARGSAPQQHVWTVGAKNSKLCHGNGRHWCWDLHRFDYYDHR